VNADSQIVQVARIVEIVEVDEQRRRRIGGGKAERAAAALSALVAARPTPFEQERKEVVLDIGMPTLWARAPEGTDLDLRRGARDGHRVAVLLGCHNQQHACTMPPILSGDT